MSNYTIGTLGDAGTSSKRLFVVGRNVYTVALSTLEKLNEFGKQYMTIKRHINKLTTQYKIKPRTDVTTHLYHNMLRHVWLPEMEGFISGWGKGLVLEDIRIVVNGIEKNLGLE